MTHVKVLTHGLPSNRRMRERVPVVVRTQFYMRVGHSGRSSEASGPGRRVHA